MEPRHEKGREVAVGGAARDEQGAESEEAITPDLPTPAVAETELRDEFENSPDVVVSELETELANLNDRHLRLAAEFNNYRRRTENERLEAWTRAQAELVGKLLDVLDDLQRISALEADQTTLEGLMEGIDLVERKFVRTLEEAGASVIDPVGEPFDPERMEAMMRVPAGSEEDDDVVQQVFQKGYEFKGRLVRPARVSVSKHG